MRHISPAPRIVVSGVGALAADAIEAMLSAGDRLTVCGVDACERVLDWAAADHIDYVPRVLLPRDVRDADALVIAETDEDASRYAAQVGRAAGVAVSFADDAPAMNVRAAERVTGHVTLVGAGPGDPDLLTRRAARLLETAEVVIHDRLVSPEILALVSSAALRLDVGKKGFGASTPQGSIDDLMIAHAKAGSQVVRLKAGDPGIFGRMDEETKALDAAGIAWSVVPGITAAAAAAADIGVSLTRRGRNQALNILTGHDVGGYAEHDWKRLAQPGQTAAIYMGLRAATFLRGRLLMFGASAATPVTVVFDASRATREVVATNLLDLPAAIASAKSNAAAVILYGLEPHRAHAALPHFLEARA